MENAEDLLPPTDLNCHPDGSGEHLISWNCVIGAKKYLLGFGGSPDGEALPDIETMTTEIRLKTLKMDQSYEIRLHCIDDAGKKSEPAIICYYTGPLPPSDIFVIPGTDSFEVSYRDDNESKKTYTVVATPIGEGEPVKKQTQAHTVLLIGLDPGKRYEVCVFSECGGRKSPMARCGKLVRTHCREDDEDSGWDTESEFGAEDNNVMVNNDNANNDLKTEEEERPCQGTSSGSSPSHGDTKHLSSVSSTESSSDEERLLLVKKRKGGKFKVKHHKKAGEEPMKKREEEVKMTITEEIICLKELVRDDSNVYKGKHRGRRDEIVAIKIIKSPTDDNYREVEHLHMATEHENVVNYYSSGTHKHKGRDILYIAMELCDTDTLEDIIKKNKERCPKRKHSKKLLDVRQISEGLRHLHHVYRIIHRDLKPQNILYKDGKCKVSDFGLSKRLQYGKSRTRQGGCDIGTDGWRAPETSEIEAKSSFKSDVFSLGLIFHYILTDGKHPFGDNKDYWQPYIRQGIYLSLRICKNMPDSKIVEDLLLIMLSHDPEERPTIADVLEHPIFWTWEKKIKFYDHIRKYGELWITRQDQVKKNKKAGEKKADGKQAKKGKKGVKNQLQQKADASGMMDEEESVSKIIQDVSDLFHEDVHEEDDSLTEMQERSSATGRSEVESNTKLQLEENTDKKHAEMDVATGAAVVEDPTASPKDPFRHMLDSEEGKYRKKALSDGLPGSWKDLPEDDAYDSHVKNSSGDDKQSSSANEKMTLPDNWKDCLPLTWDEQQLLKSGNQLPENTCIQKKVTSGFDTKSVSDLIKFTRNRRYYQLSVGTENIVMTDQQIWDFHEKRFPCSFKLPDNWKTALLLSEKERELFKHGDQLPDNDCIQKKVTKGYDTKSVYDLIRFARNREYHQLEFMVTANIQMTDQQIWDFYSERYPYLFIHAYHTAKKYLKDGEADEHFKNLFSTFF